MKKTCFESSGSCLAIRDETCKNPGHVKWLKCAKGRLLRILMKIQVGFNKDEKYTFVSYQLIGVAPIFTL